MLAIFIFILIFIPGFSQASDSSFNPTASTEETSWSLIRKKLQAADLSELSFPAFQGINAIPNPDNSANDSANWYHILWVSYDIAPHYKIIYWQRTFLLLSSYESNQGMKLLPREPRFAIRRTELIDVPHLKSSLDLYLQPSLFTNERSSRNNLEIGIRFSGSYTAPTSRWSFGLLADLTSAYQDSNGKGAKGKIGLAPWVSYGFNSVFSTQHTGNLSFVNVRTKQIESSPSEPVSNGFDFNWGDQPSVQNGIAANLSESTSVSVLLNTYLTTLPTLKNSWASLQLSIQLL